MFTQRYVLISAYEDEDEDLEPVCTYYDFDELHKAIDEFEKTKGWVDITLIDQFTGRVIRQMEACDYTLPVINPRDPADWWKPEGWSLD